MKPKRKRIPNIQPEAPAPVIPTIKLKNKQLAESRGAFATLTSLALPAATAVRLTAMARQLQNADEDCDKQRIELCKQFGTLNEETNKYEFPNDEAENEFKSAYAELQEKEIEIKGRKLTVFDFGKTEVQPQILMPLDWLIDLE